MHHKSRVGKFYLATQQKKEHSERERFLFYNESKERWKIRGLFSK
jgi:hypothetical protein